MVESTKNSLGTNRTKRVEKRKKSKGKEGGRGWPRMADDEMSIREDGCVPFLHFFNPLLRALTSVAGSLQDEGRL